MTNQCPICLVPIRSNAALCTRHSIQRDLDCKDTRIVLVSRTKTEETKQREHRRKAQAARYRRTHP